MRSKPAGCPPPGEEVGGEGARAFGQGLNEGSGEESQGQAGYGWAEPLTGGGIKDRAKGRDETIPEESSAGSCRIPSLPAWNA